MASDVCDLQRFTAEEGELHRITRSGSNSTISYMNKQPGTGSLSDQKAGGQGGEGVEGKEGRQ